MFNSLKYLHGELFLIIFSFIILTEEVKGSTDFLASRNGCAAHIHKYEQQYNIPAGLLQAISKAESGRKDHTGRIMAWPWTINVNGRGYFFPSKEAAIKAVQAMQRKGIQSIDIGCMQVNLYYHPDAFPSLEEAFEPSSNIDYAARFLTDLKKDHDSWYRAIAHYHSANPIHHIPYQKTVLKIWNREGYKMAESLGEEIVSKVNHIRRLMTAKTLKIINERVTTSTSNTVRYRKMQGNSYHVRRLKLSSNK